MIVILLGVLVFIPLQGTSNKHDEDIFLLDLYTEKIKILDDLPLQDARIIRDMQEEVTYISTLPLETSLTSVNANASEGSAGSSQEWIEEAIKDIAYYLRAHKFNEYDRRYELNDTLAPRTFYHEYPRPALRSLHWEVHKFCDESFFACIKYLWKRTQEADLRRGDDTAVVIQEQKWQMEVDHDRIAVVDAECRKLQRRDDIRADPFQGPLERFQWRSTASYFMCWYTMHEVEYLRHIKEYCDNFANCLDSQYGPRNHDPRANDEDAFACALYSFCPDACCHEKHSNDLNFCWEMPMSNPCYSANTPGQRECLMNRSQNLDFTSGILNHWNVTCACPRPGYVWDSSYGICVDVDECQRGEHKCDVHKGQACLNTVGGFKCVCKWGHTWSNEMQICQKNEAISQITLIALKMQAKKANEKVHDRSYLKRAYKFFTDLISKKVNINSTASKAPLLDTNSYLVAIVSLISIRADVIR